MKPSDPAEQLAKEITLLVTEFIEAYGVDYGRMRSLVLAIIRKHYPPANPKRLKKGPILKHLDAIWKAGMNELEQPPQRKRGRK